MGAGDVRRGHGGNRRAGTRWYVQHWRQGGTSPAAKWFWARS